MIRKQVYIEPEQDEKLKRLSKHLGVTEAELIRRAINSLEGIPEDEISWNLAFDIIEKLARRRVPSNESLPWSRSDVYKDQLRRLDPSAWIEELAFIEERERLLSGGGSTDQWRREDSYDERRSRLSH